MQILCQQEPLEWQKQQFPGNCNQSRAAVTNAIIGKMKMKRNENDIEAFLKTVGRALYGPRILSPSQTPARNAQALAWPLSNILSEFSARG